MKKTTSLFFCLATVILLVFSLSERRKASEGTSSTVQESRLNLPVEQEEKPARVFPFYRKGKIGFIDKTGRVVVEPQFEPGFLYFAAFTEFSEGMARISVEREDGGLPGVRSRIGFIDTTGKVAIEPQFDEASDFSEGLAAVQTKDGWGYIDATGRVVIKPQFDGAGEFVEGIARVTFEKYHGDVPHFGRRIGYIDRAGKYVWRPSR